MKRLSSIFIICLMQVLTVAASTFNLNVEVTPPGAASLNSSGGTYEEGAKVSLRASTHTGFLFQGWYEGEEKVASTLSFTYTMPARDASLQARFNYDPDAPANPAMPDTCTYYTLTAVASPEGAASLNLYEGRYKAGASVSLRASGHTGFVFDGWSDGTGGIVSSSASFNFTMPARDERLTALYHYDPAAPANPEQMGVVYTTSIQSRPAGGGSFNTNSIAIKEGDNARLYAYTHPGFRFLRWEDENGTVLSDRQDFYYVMPNGGGKLFGVFEYDPAPPANPGKNWWDKELGNVIVDDFTPGGLYSALTEALAGSNRDAVGMITVAGVMNNNDFSIANNFSSCTLLDLSRVTGVSTIPSYAFDNTSLESVYLPSTIEQIGARAFENCSQLSKLTVYAMTPPALESNVFRGIPKGLVVYVPGAALSQYQDAEGWKDFTILPITEDVRNLTVNLPSDVDPKAYAHMWLEIRNTKSGQRMHYVMTDRKGYTFSNIIRNTSWEVTLRNERGDIFGSIPGIDVNDDDVTVGFTSLSLPQTMSLTVVTPEGEDVTDRIQISWTDSEGSYLGQSSSLTGLPEGMEISYRLTLPQDLAVAYMPPSETSCKVSGSANEVKSSLEPIPVVNMSGSVKDSASGLPIANALVTASQTFAGKYTKTVTGKTDAKGAFLLKLNEVPTSLTVSSSDYVSRSLVCDSLMTGDADIALTEISLKPISGAVISLDFRYKGSALQDEVAEEQGWYDDYANVSYTIFNKTRNKPVTQFNVQYPVIVLLEEVGDYDQLEITASSVSDRFMPVTDIVTIDEAQKGDICFHITGLGGLQATFVKNTNPAVAAQLYDSKGNLCKNGGYSNSKWSVSGLKDGRYTLVTMGQNQLYNSISSLGQLSQTGLVEGVDYALNEIDVKSGLISEVKIESVPKLDESKLYYTGTNTSFTVNKPSIVAGNFLTLTGKIDFKPAYASQVGNVNLIVDLPEACDFVENSVMVGNTVSNYVIEGRRLTVPLNTVADRVRFCIVPTLGGEYAPSAFARFDMNGETVTQPIGSASYSVKNLSISVPSTVAKTTIPVSGTAAGRSTVEIYDGETLIGQTQSLANGQWSANCELKDPYNLSKHDIYARVTTKDGHDLRSETVECTYDMNAIGTRTVSMSFYNGWLRKNVTVVFDLENKTVDNSSYMFYTGTDITFVADLTNNDPDVVSDVVIKVYTDHGHWHILPAEYDASLDRWVAIERFESTDLPIGVKVDFSADPVLLLDSNLVSDIDKEMEDLVNLYKNESEEVENMDSNLFDIIDYTKNKEFMDYISTLSETQIDSLINDNTRIVEFMERSERLKEFSDSIFNLESSNITLPDLGIEYRSIPYVDYSDEELIGQGFKEYPSTCGLSVFMKREDSVLTVIDKVSSTSFEIVNSEITDLLLQDNLLSTRASSKELQEQLVSFTDKIRGALSTIQTRYKKLEDKLIDLVKVFEENEKEAKYVLNAQDFTVKQKNKKLDRLLRELAAETDVDKKAWKQLEINVVQTEISQAEDLIKTNAKKLKDAQNAIKDVKYLRKWLGKILPVMKYLSMGYEAVQNMTKVYNLYVSMPEECKCFPKELQNAQTELTTFFGLETGYLVARFTIEMVSDFTSLGALVATGGTALPLVGFKNLVKAIVIDLAIDATHSFTFNQWNKRMTKVINKLKVKCAQTKCNDDDEDDDDGDDDDGDDDDDNDNDQPPYPQTTPIHDPSGYVYEAVASNRVEGVTATVFYKEMVEDMYGDLHENIVKWDAEEYAQKNPLFTDEFGMYAWDVPQGLWQVRFEKEGYETTFSEWLPVPPPQLEVNIPIKQNVQPNVKAARAFEDAVELEFDKYMRPETLTTENVMVLVDDKPLAGSVTLLNEEESYDGSGESFASKVRFNAAEPFPAEKVTLLVKNRVKSYADVRMENDYIQAFTVELEVRRIECDSVVDVAYGGSKVMKLSVLPGSAAAGKKLNVNIASAMTISTDAESVVLDDEGCAEIVISGDLPGVGAVQFSLEGYDMAAFTLVNVKKDYNKVATPTVNIASGSTVDKGTEVYLNCDTEGAVIYYTLDGSCPCDDTEGRKEYDGKPIIVNEDVTIKAMAYAPDMYESEIATYVFYATDSSVGEIELSAIVRLYPVPMHETLNISAGDSSLKRVAFTNMTGATVVIDLDGSSQTSVDVSRFPAGIYMVTVETDRGNVTRKLIKSN